jgi:phasin family protein
MLNEIKDLLSDNAKALRGQAERFREDPVESTREALVGAAERVRSLNEPVRAFADSGVKLVGISQTAVRSLIELQTNVVTATLTDTATRLQRTARAENLLEVVRGQSELLKASGTRVVDDAKRAAEIVTEAGHDVRKVGSELYSKVFASAKVAHRGGRATRARKTTRAVRKPAARKRAA